MQFRRLPVQIARIRSGSVVGLEGNDSSSDLRLKAVRARFNDGSSRPKDVPRTFHAKSELVNATVGLGAGRECGRECGRDGPNPAEMD